MNNKIKIKYLYSIEMQEVSQTLTMEETLTLSKDNLYCFTQRLFHHLVKLLALDLNCFFRFFGFHLHAIDHLLILFQQIVHLLLLPLLDLGEKLPVLIVQLGHLLPGVLHPSGPLLAPDPVLNHPGNKLCQESQRMLKRSR